MNRETSVEIGYFVKGKLIISIWSDIFPNYNSGDSVELRSVPTNRERTRRPAQEWSTRFFIVERVHHVIQQSRSDESLFTLRLEVYLTEPED